METLKRVLVLLVFIFGIVSCKEEVKSEIITEEPIVVEPMDKVTEEPEAPKLEKQSIAALKEELTTRGFKVFDYVNEKTKDTVLMQQYFMAFLKDGPIRNQNEEEVVILQEEHLAHLGKMYDLGYADISGPFGDDGDIRGITIYNVPTQKMADSLANSDPMVKAGRLIIEMHPWWAAKGYKLR
ncbi:YciI family protein [Winogradskyella pacifica]|uniref:YciI family protein n=1 Tax=Winogradskyella pacifica TaxID=664642 RepID=UPI0015CD3733